MANKQRNHYYWIIGIICLTLVINYCYFGFIDKGDIVYAIFLAIVIEFQQYCIGVYRKDHEKITTY
jgi:hypothetical protein